MRVIALTKHLADYKENTKIVKQYQVITSQLQTYKWTNMFDCLHPSLSSLSSGSLPRMRFVAGDLAVGLDKRQLVSSTAITKELMFQRLEDFETQVASKNWHQGLKPVIVDIMSSHFHLNMAFKMLAFFFTPSFFRTSWWRDPSSSGGASPALSRCLGSSASNWSNRSKHPELAEPKATPRSYQGAWEWSFEAPFFWHQSSVKPTKNQGFGVKPWISVFLKCCFWMFLIFTTIPQSKKNGPGHSWRFWDRGTPVLLFLKIPKPYRNLGIVKFIEGQTCCEIEQRLEVLEVNDFKFVGDFHNSSCEKQEGRWQIFSSEKTSMLDVYSGHLTLFFC